MELHCPQLSDGTRNVLFEPLEPAATPGVIEKICMQYNEATCAAQINPLLLIPEFVLGFLCIHPFADGNGRMSRLLTTLMLYRSGFYVGRYISLEKMIEDSKETYYEALAASNQGWHDGINDADPFRRYLLGTVLAAYREFERRADLFPPKRSALEQVEAAVMEQIGQFTKRDILEWVPHLSRASVENALRGLTQSGVIVRHGAGRGTYYTRRSQ